MFRHIHAKRVAFLIVFFVFHCAIAYNFYFLAKDTISGDSSASKLLVKPRYNFMRVPANDLTKQYGAENRLSGDFAQIYFPTRASSPNAYNEDSPDPWHRHSRYAPFVHAVCRYSLCRLPYGYAGFLNMLVQLSLLYASFFIAFRRLGIERHLPASILLANTCLFLTPVGLSWFERGQFSVFVTLAYLWLIMGIIKRNPRYLVFSALFAYFKWTSFPFISVVGALWLLNSKSLMELKRNVSLAILVPSTIAMLFLFDLKDGIAFLGGLLEQELASQPAGLSLGLLIPRALVKSLPLVLVVLGYLSVRKNKGEFALLMPYLAAAGVLSVLYPTWSFDYSTPCLLCFIPLLIHWTQLAKMPRQQAGGSGSAVPWQSRMQQVLPAAATALFCAFLLIASSFNSVADFYGWPRQSTIYVYVACAIALMGTSLLSTPVRREQRFQGKN